MLKRIRVKQTDIYMCIGMHARLLSKCTVTLLHAIISLKYAAVTLLLKKGRDQKERTSHTK